MRNRPLITVGVAVVVIAIVSAGLIFLALHLGLISVVTNLSSGEK